MSNPEFKYIIVKIDPHTGSFIYENTIVDQKAADAISDDVPFGKTPYETLNETHQQQKSIKIKVKRLTGEPTIKEDFTFELDKKWYTLLLKEKINNEDTVEYVTKDWFGDTSLDENPFDAYMIFSNHEDIVKNIKYLYKMGSLKKCNFNEMFKDFVEKSVTTKNSTLEIIQKSLSRPYFAIKTVLDMKMVKKDENDNDKPLLNYYIDYLGTDGSRFGYPNISGDKSHIIAGLQLLYDITGFCTDCLSDSDGKITKILEHVKFRNYFLKSRSSQIGAFDSAVEKFKSFTTPYAFLQNVLKADKIQFASTTTSAVASPSSIPPDTSKKLLIVEGPHEQPKDCELIGQIYKFQKFDQYIYYDVKTGYMYNDVEVRKDQDVITQLTYYTDESKTISFYRKNSMLTYRDLFIKKYLIDNNYIEYVLSKNYNISYMDEFIPDVIDDNVNKKIHLFIIQYLTYKSDGELNALIENEFDKANPRFGICNYTGELSYFIAAMQLVYDCCPRRSFGLDKSKMIDKQNAYNTLIMQILNAEYSVSRICSNIETIIPPGNIGSATNPLTLNVNMPGNKQLNVFSNYKVCVEYIQNRIETHLFTLVENGAIGLTNGCEKIKEKLDNNYYFLAYQTNVFAKIPKSHISAIANKMAEEEHENLSVVTKLFKDGTDGRYRDFNINMLASQIKDTVIAGKMKEILKNNPLLPNILRNKCVDTIHKLFIVLSTANNVFVDFMEDQRPFSEKQQHFDTVAPNFVIKIGNLPTIEETTKHVHIDYTSFATGNNDIWISGVYSKDASSEKYTHTEHSGYIIELSSGNWVVKSDSNILGEFAPTAPTAPGPVAATTTAAAATTAPGPVAATTTAAAATTAPTAPPTAPTAPPTTAAAATTTAPVGAVPSGLKILDDMGPGLKDTTGNIIKASPGYIPYYIDLADKNLQEKITVPNESTLGDSYTFTLTGGSVTYKVIGTIYKSIHHDYYYKYYEHDRKRLFFDCSKEDSVYEIEQRMQKEMMFPFIRLYKSNAMDYKSIDPGNNRFLYPDILKFNGNANVNTKNMDMTKDYN
jgi:hypothetical protein